MSLNNLPEYRMAGCFVLQIETGEEDYKKWRPVMNYCISSQLVNVYLGRNVHVVTVGGE